MIELIGLSKSYAGQPVLHNINLFIQEGEIFGIIGKSGAGKSTLLRCINLLEKPNVGQVICDNEDLTVLSSKKLRHARHKTAMIFQHFNLLNHKTVYDNIALPMRIQRIDETIIREKINDLLQLIELSDKCDAYPAQLSGGQKQRVAIARALSCSPKILLCDEPTSALDPETTDSILALLQKINQWYNITIVIITHQMDVIKRICHRVALMDQGNIVEALSLQRAFENKTSMIRNMLFTQLNPKLPTCLTKRLSNTPNTTPLLRLFFEGHAASVPFISRMSRELNINVNILLANVDRIDNVTCGVLIIELQATPTLLEQFIAQCVTAHLTVEILGYVTDDVF